MSEWFYSVGQEQRGPVTDTDLRAMLSRGELYPTQLVWRAGMDRWQPLESVGIGPAAVSPVAYATAVTTASYAGFGDRLLAWVVDFFVLVGIRLAAMFALGLLSIPFEQWIEASETRQMTLGFVFLAVSYLCGFFYYALMECSSRQATLGKLARGIQVCDLEGGPPSFMQTAVRYVLRLVSVVTVGFGFLMITFTARRQALHDIGANCLVLRKPPVPVPAAVL
jgi:uncharacterized RDD family membrane protein YckC